MTSTAFQVYRRAVALGLELRANGDKLVVVPGSKCPADFADELRRSKVELMAWLTNPPCPGWGSVPPDPLPLNSAVPVVNARARELMIHFVRRQRALAAWLVRRESAYFEGPGKSWDCGSIAYRAAIDAACWQLRRNEPAVVELLEGLEQGFDNLRKQSP